MRALLTIRDLHVRYRLSRSSEIEVVHGVSMDIQPGQTVAVVGESGSGKTTLAMTLCGLAPASAGDVWFRGEKLPRDRNMRLIPDRKRVALMFQDPAGSLSPRMTIRKSLAEPFRIHKTGAADPDREALRLLSLVGLDESFAERYPHQLSGGQARRVGVARALAMRPDVLIADEPTAGLDVSVQGEVLNLLSRLQLEMGLGIMLITHNLNIVRHIADEMAIMYLGRFVEQGDSRQILDQPRHPYTAALLAANPGPDPDVRPQRIELRGDAPSLLKRPVGCEFHPRCPRAKPACSEAFPEPAREEGHQVFNCFFPIQ